MVWWNNSETTETSMRSQPDKGTSASAMHDTTNDENSRNKVSKDLFQKTNNNDVDNNNDNDDDDDDQSLSSLSYYEDFPVLYFAIRRGRFVRNSVFLSWESARRHIVDYPDAEYIATPTLQQARRYANPFLFRTTEDHGGSSEDEPRTGHRRTTRKRQWGESSTTTGRSRTTTKNNRKSIHKRSTRTANKRKTNYSTRRLLMEYYELYDPSARTSNGGQPLTISRFLTERGLYKSKFRTFAKHWQRSGLLMMSHDEKPLADAVSKYDAWVAERKQKSRKGGDTKANTHQRSNETAGGTNRKRKRKRPTRLPKHQTIIEAVDPQRSDSNSVDDKASDSNNSNSNETTNAGNETGNSNKKPKPSPATSSPTITRMQTRKSTASTDKASKRESTTTTSTQVLTIDDDEEDDNDNDENWNEMYEKLKAFHAVHGHCKPKKTEDPILHYWVHYNRRRMRLSRSGARGLTLREEKLLNDLNFDPTYQEIVTEFNKHLGKRVAKLFGTVIDDPVTKTERTEMLPYFGTVGRISSVSNRYLRIQYDDGDSEDFDMECLIEGLNVYSKYKHLDTCSHGISNTPAITGATNNPAPAAGENKDAVASNKARSNNGSSSIRNNSTPDRKSVTSKSGRPRKHSTSTSTSSSNNNAGVVHTHHHNTRNNVAVQIERLLSVPERLHQFLTGGPKVAPSPPPGGTMGIGSLTTKTNLGSSSGNNNLGNNTMATQNSAGKGSVVGATVTPSNSNHTGSSSNDSGTTTETSDDDVEVVDVLVPYRGNPNLLGLPQSGGDGSIAKKSIGNNNDLGNRYNSFGEDVFEF